MLACLCLNEQCNLPATLAFDTFVDIFFLLDILLTFNTGFIKFESGGEYVDNRIEVAKAYLQGSFLFDVVTSFPVSFFELSVQAACAGARQGDPDVGGAQLRFIRAIKPLRWFKIARILKLGKAGPIIVLFMDTWDISPKQGQSVKVAILLVLYIHITASLWWLFKVVQLSLHHIT